MRRKVAAFAIATACLGPQSGAEGIQAWKEPIYTAGSIPCGLFVDWYSANGVVPDQKEFADAMLMVDAYLAGFANASGITDPIEAKDFIILAHVTCQDERRNLRTAAEAALALFNDAKGR